MARAKSDGVIEAVRYAPGGKIALVRTFERRGAVWSDQVLLERQELIERLKKGKRFVTGQREEYLGNVFETGAAVRYVNEHIVTDSQADGRDQLTGVPIF
jgi:hypothetical protein